VPKRLLSRSRTSQNSVRICGICKGNSLRPILTSGQEARCRTKGGAKRRRGRNGVNAGVPRPKKCSLEPGLHSGQNKRQPLVSLNSTKRDIAILTSARPTCQLVGFGEQAHENHMTLDLLARACTPHSSTRCDQFQRITQAGPEFGDAVSAD
jgi:hypothetical protein